MRLNVGCGKRFEPDYFNIDFYDDLIADKKMSALNLEFDDNLFEEIKVIHVIEHLGFFESIYALSEFFRVLEPNGFLNIETPDINRAFKHYLDSDNEQKNEILGWIFGIPHIGLQHKFCFPLPLLKELLKKIGFRHITTKKFYNNESIPTLRIECKKLRADVFLDLFQIMTHIRKKMITENYVDFENSFLTKEQEDLLSLYIVKMMDFEKNKNKAIIIDLLKKTLISSPQLVKFFLSELKNKEILSNFEIEHFTEITENLISFNFQNILFNSIKKTPTIPGTQRIAFSAIESFGSELINKLITDKNNKDKSIIILKEQSEKLNKQEVNFFSYDILKRKSLDYFYLGIKEFYKKNYKNSIKKFLNAIKVYRDDFLYYWNLAKVLAKLDLKSQAKKYYRWTLRLIRISKFENKKDAKNDIKKELKWIKKMKGDIPQFVPIISLEKYLQKKKNYI